MDLRELERRIVQMGIPGDAVSLHGEMKDEAYILEQVGRHWAVYYSERGVRTDEKRFDDEAEACRYLCAKLEKLFEA